MADKSVICDACKQETPVSNTWTCIEGTKKELTNDSFIVYKRICKKCWNKAMLYLLPRDK